MTAAVTIAPSFIREVRAHGAVYCISCDAERSAKIGWSSDPLRRMQVLQTAHRHPLVLSSFIPETRSLEREIQNLFSDLRIRGEWFDNARGEIVDTFDALLELFLKGELSLCR